jgi:hypothetical protein
MTYKQTGQTPSEKPEEALLKALMQGLQQAQERGETLPSSFTAPPSTEQQTQTTIVTPVPETSQQSGEPTTLVTPSKKRKQTERPSRVSTETLASEKPAETVTTVPEKSVPSEPPKVTARQIAEMSAAQVSKLKLSQVEGISSADLVREQAPRDVKSAFRLLTSAEAQGQAEKLQVKKQKTDELLTAFSKVKNKFHRAGDLEKHYYGTSEEDKRFRRFLEEKGYTPEAFVKRVLGSSRVEAHCTFETSDRQDEICEVTIDLRGFYDDQRMTRMTIGAGVTAVSLEVFHVGPRR